MENFRLIFKQNKIDKTSLFDLEGIQSDDKEERRQTIYEGLVSPEGLMVDVVKTLEDGTQKKKTVLFRFHLDDKVAVLRIIEPITKNQIGYIGSSHISAETWRMIFNLYGIDDWQASVLTVHERGLLREVMKKKYERYGIMKAATACFRLAAKQNNIDTTETVIESDNIASWKAREVPDIEDLTYETSEDRMIFDEGPDSWRLITKTIRKPL